MDEADVADARKRKSVFGPLLVTRRLVFTEDDVRRVH